MKRTKNFQTRSQSWGALPQSDGSTQFRIWAPALESIQLVLILRDKMLSFSMQAVGDGFFEKNVSDCGHGTRYQYRLATGDCRPDPASRFQPEGVHGWSQVVDPDRYEWQDQNWRGIPKSDLIIYELHVGCFTAAGTYLAAIDRLDELAELGVTAIELMPIAESPGRWNWGYDGVDLFAPRHTYGTPDELRRLADAAHGRGFAVLLDVVYNHLGPEGNYWREFGHYLSRRHTTPWGDAPNFDDAHSRWVREFFIANAAYWIEEYHFDGLRVDALHCMADDSDLHIVTEIGEAIAGLKKTTGRQLHLIAESNVYDPEVIKSVKEGGHGWDALWCDDFLHSVSAILRPGEQMSSRQYLRHSDLDSTLRRGFVFQGTLREHRWRVPLEKTTEAIRVPIDSLVYAIQNHDFIGNHPHGLRLHQLTSIDAQKAAAALLLLTPAIPMLFMGEEFASENPFYFFVDFGDKRLREAVEQGRRAEHPQHRWTGGPSPVSPEAFELSKIGPADAGDQSMRKWYQGLIALRKQWQSEIVMPRGSMNAYWNQEEHFAHLGYGQDGEHRFVIVRLHPANETPPRLRVAGVAELMLGNNCEIADDANPLALRLGSYSVAIGKGTPTIELDGHTQPTPKPK